MRNRKYTLQKDFVFLTVSIFIIVCLWIASNIYDAYVTSTIDEVLQTQIIPIEGKFDLETIQHLKNRTVVQPDYTEVVASDEASLLTPTNAPSNEISNDEIVPETTSVISISPTQPFPSPTEEPL